MLAEERSHEGFAPLTVEALSRERFEPLTVKDTTRALGESGILSMSFPMKPGPRDLFGRSLTWLRLHPSHSDPNGKWQPVIRGAFLNAAWANATETLTREPLGSSDGRPGLTVNVVRPPLLADTLELRVREPLDEEERQALIDADQPIDADHAIIKSGLPDLPGDWVLWRRRSRLRPRRIQRRDRVRRRHPRHDPADRARRHCRVSLPADRTGR
jgi:hypothetical protein